MLVKSIAHGGRDRERQYLSSPFLASAANGEVQKAINLVTPHRHVGLSFVYY